MKSTRRPASLDYKDYLSNIRQYWNKVKPLICSIGAEEIDEIRSEICIEAESLDPNTNVHTLLRLSRNSRQIMRLKGHLGGSMILLSMAETLRRAAEDTFGIELKEEDELGFGMMPKGVKKDLYGVSRILDAPRPVKNQFIRRLGLDHSVQLRWYVEGDTEYYGLESFFGSYSGIEIINLRGHVAAKGGRGLAFRDSLRSDLEARRFSFISIDGDRSDFASAARKAARDDEICGALFISSPDFEFQNFTKRELAEVVLRMAYKLGIEGIHRSEVEEITSNSTSASDFLDKVNRLPELEQVGKGERWGKELFSYAWENQGDPNQDSLDAKRQIVEAIELALRSLKSDYKASRENLRVDPETGRPVQRQNSG